MKFNKSGKDNIIKMTNQEAKELYDTIDNIVSFSELLPTGEYSESFIKFFEGIKNLSNIGPQD